jgi:hypothetical protein
MMQEFGDKRAGLIVEKKVDVVLTRINLQVRKRTPCYYSRSHSCHSTATTVLIADSDSESNQPAKSRKVRNAREMFRRKETFFVTLFQKKYHCFLV